MTTSLIFNGRDVTVEFNVVAEPRHAVMYLSNGDPGYPAEPGELEIVSGKDEDGKALEPEELDAILEKHEDQLWEAAEEAR